MTEISEGTWFGYQLTVATSGRPRAEPLIERYTVKKIDGDRVTVVKEINGGSPETIETKTGYGSYIFDLNGLERRGAENMKTAFGHMYVNIYESENDGSSERVFLGKDGIAFRDIKTRHTEKGLYTETRELFWTNMKL